MTKLLKVNQRWFSLVSVLFAALILIITSCAKEPGKIGLAVQPEDSYLNVLYNNTSIVNTYSKIDDSVRSDELTRNSIGVINDPVFGFTKASFCTQFAPETNGHDFGEAGTRVLDSLVLQLVYSGAYGDTNTQLTIHTYEMDSSIYHDSVYYSNKNIATIDINYSNYTFMPRPNDSVEFDGDTLVPLIRINLNDLNPALGEKLLNATDTNMEDLELFQEFFKGLYLVPEDLSSVGTMAYFDLTNSLSKMTIYYGSTYEGVFQNSLQFDYLISTSMARINKYEHDYTNASPEFRQQAINGDTALGKHVFYAQGYAGVKTIVKIPYPDSLLKYANVAINEAKLIFPGYAGNQFYDAPAKMALVMAQEDGTYDFMPDQYEGDDYFGGYYESGSNQYVFRITRYIQSMISDSTAADQGLYLFVNSGSVNPESFIFSGYEPTVDTADRLKLQIIYTELD